MIRQSEIINQKLRLVFSVEQNTKNVLPREQFIYYVFVKNISGVQINNFKIKIINENNVHFDKTEQESPITLKPNETKLYTFKAFCNEPGEYIVHFVGYGDGTQIVYKTLKTFCSYDGVQESLVHKLHIYDFTPYESIYSLEVEDFSQEVTQAFKRQKPPFGVGQQPFPMLSQMIPDKNGTLKKAWEVENIESQSFIDQYNKIKKCKDDEYHYHYISRENFTEDEIETFTGSNLQELVDNINKYSTYFEAKFLKSGTNELLNDFNQYAPNGFIYRMGLLSSELYHTLGIIPEYSYMGDYLFRWAPSSHTLPNLYPQKKAMKWNENIWAGKGWNVYKYITKEYKETDEYKEKVKENKIENKTFLDSFDSEKRAEEYVDKLLYIDNIIRAQQRSDIIKYKYEIQESYLDNGVFFVNIPLSKIPSNFIIPSTEELYSIINRAKPFGAKALIKYSINEVFNHNIDFTVKPNYHIKTTFDINLFEQFYDILSKKIMIVKKECSNGQEINTINEEIVRESFYNPDINDFDLTQDFDIDISYTTQDISNIEEIEQDSFYTYELTPDNSLVYLEDILESLYQKNNNNICFYLNTDLESQIIYNENDTYNIIEIPINDGILINIVDKNNVPHVIECHKNEYYDLYHLTNYILKNNKKYIINEGFENINSLLIYKNNFLNKNIIIYFGKDKANRVHYFGHEILDNINEIKDFTDEKTLYYSKFNPITFETPFFFKQKTITPLIEQEETNWKNLYRINDHKNTYAYIDNLTMQDVSPKDIEYFFNDINLPETATIKNVCLNIKSSSRDKNIYLHNAINTNYLDSTAKNYFLCLEPTKIEAYQYNYDSTSFYRAKIEEYIEEENNTLIKKYQKLLNDSILFNESIDISTEKYMKTPNDFITVKKDYWIEISEFTNNIYKLNETQSITLIIEGYNTGSETELTAQTLSGTDFANQVTTITIPAGYFRKKVDLYYPNSFSTNEFKVRFRFNKINHTIKIFDTKINIEFKQAQDYDIPWEYVKTIDTNEENNITLLQEVNNIYDLNNGLGIKLSFDDIRQGEYYHLNTIKLYILYKETEMTMLINKNKYNFVSNNSRANTISGICISNCDTKDCIYPSIEFYNDIVTMGQPESDIGPGNSGIKLQKSLFQAFTTRDDNITNIEIFPNGVLGNPDENIKIGLYENHENTPGRLIKEVYANGWLKNNSELKDLPSIKYNINVEDLKINQIYWFKIEVIVPKDNSYYLLKSIDSPQNDFKLLINENNNYINTFSALQFNIYSKNLSRSFASLPCLQETFDNPYIKIGLHKGQGYISNLRVNKSTERVLGENYMSEDFDNEEEIILFPIKIKTIDGDEEIIDYHTTTEE